MSIIRIIAIGVSTGGTEAVRTILGELEKLTRLIPGIVIVQHIATGFTSIYANHLNLILKSDIKEVEQGDQILPGRELFYCF